MNEKINNNYDKPLSNSVDDQTLTVDRSLDQPGVLALKEEVTPDVGQNDEAPEDTAEQATKIQDERTRDKIAKKALDPWKFVNENARSSVEASTWYAGKE